jgi:hypothetical protein
VNRLKKFLPDCVEVDVSWGLFIVLEGFATTVLGGETATSGQVEILDEVDSKITSGAALAESRTFSS